MHKSVITHEHEGRDKMNLKEIKSLLDMFNDSDISKLELETDNVKLKMEKPAPAQQIVQQKTLSSIPIPELSPQENAAFNDKKPEQTGYIVKSPVVGTFYKSSSPDTPAFAPVGKLVKAGEVLCIVEAMKIMNEILSEESGEVVEVYVDDGGMVEYGQSLFRIVQVQNGH